MLLENVTWGSSDELSVETQVVYVASPTSRRCVFSLRRECDNDKENQRNNRVGPADQQNNIGRADQQRNEASRRDQEATAH